MKNKLIISGITILLLLLVLMGGTYALFTSENKESINLASGIISLDTNINNIKTYSLGVEQPSNTTNNQNFYSFENGGYVSYSDGVLNISNITPGDKFTYTLNIKNDSNIKVRYRVLVVVTGDLGDSLIFDQPTITDWRVLEIGDEIQPIDYTFELPFENSGLLLGKTGKVELVVEAIQYNGFKNVTFYNNDGTTVLLETVAPYGWDAVYIGDEPLYIDLEDTGYENMPYHYAFDGWDKSLACITEDTEFYAKYKEVVDTRLRFHLNDNDSSYNVTIDQSYKKSLFQNDTTITIPSTFNKLNVDTYLPHESTKTDSYITKINLASSIEVIEESSFEDFVTLTGLNIPEDTNLSEVKSYAFKNCSSLIELHLPTSIQKIGNNILSGCGNLEKLTIPFVGPERLVKINQTGKDFSFGYFFAEEYFDGAITEPIESYSTTYYFPSNLNTVKVYGKYIPNNSFTNCKFITELTFGDDVIETGQYCFRNCTGITNLDLGTSIVTLGTGTFHGCTSLTDVYIPENIKTVSTFAFENCYGLVNFTMASVNTVYGGQTFFRVTIPNLYYEGDVEGWCSNTLGANPGNSNNTKFYLLNENGEYYQPTDVVLPDNIKNIGALTFTSFREMTKITIPSTLESVGNNAFLNCSKLKDVYFDGTIEEWCKIDFASNAANPIYNGANLYYKENGEWKLLTELIIPETITEIGSYQFYGNTNIISVTFHEQVTSIGTRAFFGNKSLTEVNIPASLVNIGNAAFANAPSIERINVDENNQKYSSRDCNVIIDNDSSTLIAGCKNSIIPDGVISIDDYAFYNVGLVEIDIPASVVTIGSYAFSSNTRTLKRVTVAEGSNLETVGTYAFSQCKSLGFIDFRDNIKSIGSHAFYFCGNVNTTNFTIIIGKDFEKFETSVLGNAYKPIILYKGTLEDFKTISGYSSYLSYVYYYSLTAPEVEGKYWYYDAEGNIIKYTAVLDELGTFTYTDLNGNLLFV